MRNNPDITKKQSIMKIIFYILPLCLLWASCSRKAGEPPAPDYPSAPEGMRTVTFELPGTMASPLTESPSTRMGNTPGTEVDEQTLKDFTPEPLKDGTTLWVLAEDITKGVPEADKRSVLHSYVVRDVAGGRQILYPCHVTDDHGYEYTQSDVPMFLTIGRTYRFRAVAPARRFAEGQDGQILPDYGIYVRHKEYLMVTDGRYAQTSPTEQEIMDDGGTTPVQVVKMNPLIHQTAQLEFTICPAPESPGIYSLDVLPQGIEISGLQNEYPTPQTAAEYNWSLLRGDTLETKTGDDRAVIHIRKDAQYEDSFIEQQDDRLYIHCPVLPSDAFSSSVIVVFNLTVNGNPTQYSMMLNRKMFRATYTYHYRGKLSIEDGVTAINWQYVHWGMDVPIIPRP